LLRAGAIALSDLPIKLLRDATTDPKWENIRSWFVACCALISYREGHPEEAIAWTKKHPDLKWQHGALALVVRALAEHQLGLRDQARQTLAQAEAIIPAELRLLGSTDYSGPLPVPPWAVEQDWLAAEIVRREARAVVDGKAAPKSTGNNAPKEQSR